MYSKCNEFPVQVLSCFIFLLEKGTSGVKDTSSEHQTAPKYQLGLLTQGCDWPHWDSQAVNQPFCQTCGADQVKAGQKQEPSLARWGRCVGRQGQCCLLQIRPLWGSASGHTALMPLRQLAAAHTGVVQSSLPPPAFQRWCSLGLCRVCAGGSEGSLREQVWLCLLVYIQLRQSLLISVNMLSAPRVLGLPDAMPRCEAMGVCGRYLWRKSSPFCGGELDKEQGLSLQHLSGTE